MNLSKKFGLNSALAKVVLVACCALPSSAYGQQCEKLHQLLMVARAADDVLSIISPLGDSHGDKAVDEAREMRQRAMGDAHGSMAWLLRHADERNKGSLRRIYELSADMRNLVGTYRAQLAEGMTSDERREIERKADIADKASASALLALYEAILALECG